MEQQGTREPPRTEVTRPARSHSEAVVRVVIHVRGQHFVLLEYADGAARVHESNTDGEIREDWFRLVVAESFASAIEELPVQWCSFWRHRSVHWIVTHDSREAAMKPNVSRFVETAVARIADGRAVDWAAAEVDGPLSARDKTLVEQLRSLETIADVHRTTSSEAEDIDRVAFRDRAGGICGRSARVGRVARVALAAVIGTGLVGGCGKMLDKIPRPRPGPIHGGHAIQKATLASETDDKANAAGGHKQGVRR